MMKVDFKARTSANQIGAELKLRGEKLRAAMERGADDAASFVWAEAVKRAPIDEGNLQASGHYEPITVSGKFSRRVYFDEPYAAAMHEGHYNLGERSQKKQGHLGSIIVGRRYLARAFEENRPRIGRIIAEAGKGAV